MEQTQRLDQALDLLSRCVSEVSVADNHFIDGLVGTPYADWVRERGRTLRLIDEAATALRLLRCCAAWIESRGVGRQEQTPEDGQEQTPEDAPESRVSSLERAVADLQGTVSSLERAVADLHWNKADRKDWIGWRRRRRSLHRS